MNFFVSTEHYDFIHKNLTNHGCGIEVRQKKNNSGVFYFFALALEMDTIRSFEINGDDYNEILKQDLLVIKAHCGNNRYESHILVPKNYDCETLLREKINLLDNIGENEKIILASMILNGNRIRSKKKDDGNYKYVIKMNEENIELPERKISELLDKNLIFIANGGIFSPSKKALQLLNDDVQERLRRANINMTTDAWNKIPNLMKEYRLRNFI